MPSKHLHSLSVVIPVHNGVGWIDRTVEHLTHSLRPGSWKDVEIIVVDDGSTDGTGALAAQLQTDYQLQVIKQENMGRFAARRAGLDRAQGDFVFFLDSRVFTDKGAFEFVVQQLASHPERKVWNGHVEVERRGNPYARFWNTITSIVWRRYFMRPRLTSYGLDDFDLYPKGAGCFLCPRSLMKDAYSKMKSRYHDNRHSNDDTSLIREIAASERIFISPQFKFTYHSISVFKGFMIHAFHRGIVLVDGYLTPKSMFFWPLLIFLVASPVLVLALFIKPVLFLVVIGLWLALGVIAFAHHLPPLDVFSFMILTPPFTLAYGAGIWMGILMRSRVIAKTRT